MFEFPGRSYENLFVFPRKIQQPSTKFLAIGLLTSLAIALTAFMAGIEATSSTVTCKTVAVLLHFCVLSAFGWLAAQAVHAYCKMVLFSKHLKLLQTAFILSCGEYLCRPHNLYGELSLTLFSEFDVLVLSCSSI